MTSSRTVFPPPKTADQPQRRPQALQATVRVIAQAGVITTVVSTDSSLADWAQLSLLAYVNSGVTARGMKSTAVKSAAAVPYCGGRWREG